jgi:hypothetical protein
MRPAPHGRPRFDTIAFMSTADASEALRTGLARILDIWRDRLDGARDPLQGVLRLQLAEAITRGARPAADPAPAAEVKRAFDTIRAYYDNVRYTLLDPVAMVWGTVTNALRVAAAVDNVTPTQRAVFAFSADSLAAFFQAAHTELAVAESLWRAFRPMPAADCQTLAALFNVHMDARLDGPTVVALVRVLGNEGPLTSEEAQALATLQSTGLVSAAFVGIRSQT